MQQIEHGIFLAAARIEAWRRIDVVLAVDADDLRLVVMMMHDAVRNICHLPGHCGLAGNEEDVLVDEEAGLDFGVAGIEDFRAVYQEDITVILRSEGGDGESPGAVCCLRHGDRIMLAFEVELHFLSVGHRQAEGSSTIRFNFWICRGRGDEWNRSGLLCRRLGCGRSCRLGQGGGSESKCQSQYQAKIDGGWGGAKRLNHTGFLLEDMPCSTVYTGSRRPGSTQRSKWRLRRIICSVLEVRKEISV